MKKRIKMKMILAIVVAALVAKPVVAQATKKAFEKRIVVSAREIRIDSLVKMFTKQTGLEFSFNSNKISPSKKVTVPRETRTLSQWLSILKETAGAGHKVVGNHIILVDNNKRNISAKNSGLKTSKQKSATGKPDVLNSASISKKQKPIVLPSNQEQPTRTAGLMINNPTNDTIPSTNIPPAIAVKKDVDHTKSVNESAVGKVKEQVSPTVVTPATPVIEPSNQSRFEDYERGNEGLKNHAIQLVAGWSRHGSGDMRGIIFGGEYIRYYGKRFSLNYNFRGGINSSKYPLFYQPPGSGSYNDASIRSTTAGVQLGVNAGLSFIRTITHEIKINAGPFIRYQSESLTDGYSIYQTGVTGIPGPVVQFHNQTPHERFAVGGILQLEYNFTFNNKTFLGPIVGFQTDSDGNAIPQIALVIGRRL